MNRDTQITNKPKEAAEDHKSSAAPNDNSEHVIELFQQIEVRRIPYSRRIFANRNLHMRSVQMVGFDMDYTLAVYHTAIEELAVDLTLERLVRNRGYPKAIKSLTYDPTFAIRGLVIDKRLGNLIKMDHHRHISDAYHGVMKLEKDARRSAYRNERIRMSAQRFALVDTLFAIPEAWLFAKLIDIMESKAGEPLGSEQYQRIFNDIRETIDTVHSDQSLKDVIRADLPKYIQRDEQLAPALHRFRSAGKRLFLMTNSYGPYSQAVMSYLLDDALVEYPSWKQYFDIIIVGSQKPGFFTGNDPFLELDEAGESTGHIARSFDRGIVYQGGNISDFEAFAGVTGDHILYVGDNLYGDILRSKKASTWRTAMIIPEMERELKIIEDLSEKFARRTELEAQRSQLDSELRQQQIVLRSMSDLSQHPDSEFDTSEVNAFIHATQVAKRNVRKLQRALRKTIAAVANLNAKIETTFNENWGMLFKARDEHSIFGGQVEDYACIYTSRVSNFAAYSPWQYFRTPRDFMAHEHHALDM
jgi:5'-nucleotidase